MSSDRTAMLRLLAHIRHCFPCCLFALPFVALVFLCTPGSCLTDLPNDVRVRLLLQEVSCRVLYVVTAISEGFMTGRLHSGHESRRSGDSVVIVGLT